MESHRIDRVFICRKERKIKVYIAFDYCGRIINVYSNPDRALNETMDYVERRFGPDSEAILKYKASKHIKEYRIKEKLNMICNSKHTKYDPDQNEFNCPKCGSKVGTFAIEESFGSEE